MTYSLQWNHGDLVMASSHSSHNILSSMESWRLGDSFFMIFSQHSFFNGIAWYWLLHDLLKTFFFQCNREDLNREGLVIDSLQSFHNLLSLMELWRLGDGFFMIFFSSMES
ncbi:hypothetical protein F8M41_007635 [Gigaspora margarita]|uniref:Uncharacterized protein n=1 Tax=Gigaspora margarita TaxID=4874 RepID=A0A8H3X4R8_GIGMA|nr:hypothetical protein F8M41_007635 [Gigaspora margarita]